MAKKRDDELWVRFLPSRYITGTDTLSAAERGVYWTLCAKMYESRAPISNDTRALARACAISPAMFVKVLVRLIDDEHHKIIVTPDGKLWNGRVEHELRRAREAHDNKAKGGHAKAAKTRAAARESAKQVGAKVASKRAKKPHENNGPPPALQVHDVGSAPESQSQTKSQSQTSNEEAPPERLRRSSSRPNGRGGAAAVRDAISDYQELAERIGLQRIVNVTTPRHAKLKALLDRHGLGQWRAALARVEASEFCRGSGERGWKATFDWLLRPDTLTKLLEGAYDDHRQSARAPPVRSADPERAEWNRVLEEARKKHG